jgi:hypothetical protein
MDDAKSESSTSDTTARMLEGEIRALVRSHKSAKATPARLETGEEALAIGLTSIADIEKLIEDLLTARDYLQSEGERVRRLNTRYAHLAQTASASAKIIADSMGKWRNLETVSQTPSLPGAPTLAPLHDGEAQDQPSDQ